MLIKRVIGLILLLTSSSAYSGDLAGLASVIDGDTLEIHCTRSACGGLTRQRATSSVGAGTVFNIVEARATSVGGATSRPSAFAVFKLITNSNFVGACTGRSPGRARFKILST